jgi:hypothetical protein
MWGLFTRALTLASSTVRVSVINTSANFMLTAVLGLIIFRETLPGKFEQVSLWPEIVVLTRGRIVVARSKFLGRGICDYWKTRRGQGGWRCKYSWCRFHISC